MVEQEVIDCMNDLVNKVVRQDTDRRYREKNKEKIAQKKKQYHEKNREKLLQKQKEYYHENRDKLLQKNREYYDQNKDKIREYEQSDNGRKLRRINCWKHQGIICDNWDALYDHYLKTSFCDLCKVQLTYDSISTATTKTCDHDHSITDRPNFRNILCQSCNVRRK